MKPAQPIPFHCSAARAVVRPTMLAEGAALLRLRLPTQRAEVFLVPLTQKEAVVAPR